MENPFFSLGETYWRVNSNMGYWMMPKNRFAISKLVVDLVGFAGSKACWFFNLLISGDW